MKTEATTACPLTANLGDVLSSARVAPPKTTLDACVQSIKWAADAAFENAMGELMRRFMTFGPEVCPEWKETVQQLVSQRLAVADLLSQTVTPPALTQSTPP